MPPKKDKHVSLLKFLNDFKCERGLGDTMSPWDCKDCKYSYYTSEKYHRCLKHEIQDWVIWKTEE